MQPISLLLRELKSFKLFQSQMTLFVTLIFRLLNQLLIGYML